MCSPSLLTHQQMPTSRHWTGSQSPFAQLHLEVKTIFLNFNFANFKFFLRSFSQLDILGQTNLRGRHSRVQRVEIVHVSGAFGVAEGFTAVALLVETVAQDGRLAGVDQLLLETNVTGFRAADGKFAQRR